MKKKKWLLIVGGILVLAVAAVVSLCLIFRRTEDVPMPVIAFYYFDYETNGLYICADGSIYASKSRKIDLTPMDEITRRVQQKDGESGLELVGTTDPKKVQKMYNLFDEVVVRGDYRLEPVNILKPVPNGAECSSGQNVRASWVGVYEKPDGQLTIGIIFSTEEEYTCNDPRGLRLVEWMDKTLDEYKEIRKKENARKKEQQKTAEYPIALSENAVIYKFPPENIASLKSIAIDKSEKHEIRIYEFDVFMDFATKERLERIVADHATSETTITAPEGVQFVDDHEVKMFSTPDSYYIMVIVEQGEEVEVDGIIITIGQKYMMIEGTDSPHLTIVNHNAVKYGEEGTLCVDQRYNASIQRWEEETESFVSTSWDEAGPF